MSGRMAAAAPLLAWLAGAVTLACAATAGLLGTAGSDGLSWKRLVLSAVWVLPGALVAAGRPRIAVGWLLLGVGLLFATSGLADQWVAREGAAGPGAAWAIWWSDRFSGLLVVLMCLALFLLPDGRLPTRRWHLPVVVLVAVQVATVLAWSLASGPATAPGSDWPDGADDLANPVGVLPTAVGEAVGGADLVVLQVPLLLALFAFAARARRSEPEERARVVGVLLAAGVFTVLVVVGRLLWPAASDVFDVAASALLAAVLTAAVLRRRLQEVAVVVHHAVVLGTLTLLIAGGYVGLSALAGSAGQDLPAFAAGLLAAVVALAVQPLRGRLQRSVDRLLRGDGRDPYVALQRLADRTHDASTVGAVLAELAETVRLSLRVPWARAESADGRGAESGERPALGREASVALSAGGAPVGQVQVVAGPGRRYAREELEMLGALGRHGGLAVQATLLAERVQASRARLVAAREEESRRLRRDLHDELGPTLAGLSMQLGALHDLLPADPRGAQHEVARLAGIARGALDDVRSVSRGLRPPALDQLGLVEGLRQLAASLRVPARVDAGPLSDLPAAVEVAAFRIAAEALTNASRHAPNAPVVLRLRVGQGELVVDVRDRGPGLLPTQRDGVGLVSMRERAEELGGQLDVRGEPGAGTQVVARLPLPAAVPGAAS